MSASHGRKNITEFLCRVTLERLNGVWRLYIAVYAADYYWLFLR